MNPIIPHLKHYLRQRGISAHRLEKEAGIGKGVLPRILRGECVMSPKTLAKLEPFVKWPVACQAEVEETRAWQQTRAREGERVKPFSRERRVAELKQAKPIYARAWL